MLKQNRKSKESGFTIIEVMIVLAIAGLIMLIVFLAVPALQRNSRNTQAKNEASTIVGAVSEHVSNNNGRLPTAADAASIITSSNVKNITTLTVAAGTSTAAPNATTAVLKTAARCNRPVTPTFTGTVGAAGVTSTGSSRQYALLYPMEDKAGDATGCVDS